MEECKMTIQQKVEEIKAIDGKVVLFVAFPLVDLVNEPESEKHFILEKVLPIFPEAKPYADGFPPFILHGRLVVLFTVSNEDIRTRMETLQGVLGEGRLWINSLEGQPEWYNETKQGYLNS